MIGEQHGRGDVGTGTRRASVMSCVSNRSSPDFKFATISKMGGGSVRRSRRSLGVLQPSYRWPQDARTMEEFMSYESSGLPEQASQQEQEVRREIELELRLRDGALKLLGAAGRREQEAESAAAVVVSNLRLSGLMSRLTALAQGSQDKGSDEACKGTAALAGIRVPLIWSNKDYFKKKGESGRVWRVFLVARAGTEVRGSSLLTVDASMSDVTFPDNLVFNKISADVEIRLSLYASEPGGGTLTSVSGQLQRGLRRLSSTLGRRTGASLSRRLGRRLSTLKEEDLEPRYCGPNFREVAWCSVAAGEASSDTRSHSLVLEGATSLPLFGFLSAQLAVRPAALDHPPSFVGRLKIKTSEGREWKMYHCAVGGAGLGAWTSEAGYKVGVPAHLTLTFDKVEETTALKRSRMARSVRLWEGGVVVGVVSVASSSDHPTLLKALQQHLKHYEAWGDIMRRDMAIEQEPQPSANSRRHRRGRSLYELVQP